MEVNQQDNSVLMCVEAFKQGDHDEALRLLPSLQQHATIQTDYAFHEYNLTFKFTNVSLLHLAALHGWMDIVASLVCEYNCNSQCCDSGGQIPLHYAAHGGSLPVVQYLITEQHCDPLQCNNYNSETPFLYACEAGHLDIVEYLITECKCDPASSNNGESDLPIHLACYSGKLKIVKYLFSNKYCTPDCKGEHGWTPLHNACDNGNMEIVEYLIKKIGCDPAIPDNDGDLPIHLACYSGHLNVVKYLIKELSCDPAIRDSNGDLPIHVACLGGQLDIVKYLIINQYSSPNCKGKWGYTPLHYACDKGHINIIQYLIRDSGCILTSADNSGNMAIHIACFKDHLEVVKYLVSSHYFSPNCAGRRGQTPLRVAFNGGHIEIVQYLIQNLDILPDIDIESLVILGGRWLNILKYLISIQYPYSEQCGHRLLHSACEVGNMESVRYLTSEVDCDLSSPDNDGNFPIHIACLSGHLNIVEYLLSFSQKYNPNCKGKGGRTPLHIACNEGHIKIVEYLTEEVCCDPASPDNNGDLPIHVACLGGQLDIVKYLIINQYSSPNSKGKCGYTPLHHACDKGHMKIIKYLTRDSGCILTSTDNGGNMAIHTSCLTGQLEAVKYLVSGKYFSPNCTGSHEQTPLNVAFHSDHMEIVQYLISNIDTLPDINIELLVKWLNIFKYLISIQCPNSEQCGQRLLRSACEVGSVESVRYLTSEVDCDLSSPDNDGNFPIHIACLGGHLNVVKCLSQKCNPNCKGKGGRTPLHCACVKGHMNIIQYLLMKLGCDPSVLDDEGSTPLHLASNMGHIEIVRWLLRDSRVNVLSMDKSGCIPMDSAELTVNDYESLEVFQLFRPLIQSMKEYPIHLCTKVVLTGNSGAGKTKLSEAFVSPRWFHHFKEQPPLEKLSGEQPPVEQPPVEQPPVERLPGEQPPIEQPQEEQKQCTAGIVSHHVLNQHIILYDLAGHVEFYFSQSTVMEVVVRNSRAIFVNLVDLSMNDKQITDSVHYWLNFIEDTTSRSDEKSFLLIVGSHADLINEFQIEERKQLVNELVAARKKLRLEYAGLVSMDCRDSDSELDSDIYSFKQFFTYVAKCRQSILAEAPSLSIYCHTLYAFLQTKIDKVACQLQALVSLLASEGSVVPAALIFVSELLESLNNKGVIVYLKNEQCLEKSYVIVKKEVILFDVKKKLFLTGKHPKIASNTGIIRHSSFHEVFHEYDLDMLVELLVSLEFCVPINLPDFKTNLQAIVPDDTSCLFFPALLTVDQPQSNIEDIQQSCAQNFKFGWCLGSKDYAYQYFTYRFIYILLLRLVYNLSHPCETISQTHALHGLEQKCTIWKNGISWNNDDGIRTVVEVIQQSRWVVVTMFHNKDTRPVEYSRHRSEVIRLVLKLQQELAPYLETIECLISPTLLQQWPLKQLSNTDLFTIKNVVSSALQRKPRILSCEDDKHQLTTSDALFFEPYHLLSPSSVCELMDSSKNDQPVSPALLSEVRECCQQPQLESQSYLSLREHLDKMSIFAGRNPLVVAKLEPGTVICRQSSLSSSSSSAVTIPAAQQAVEQLSSDGGPSPHAPSSLKMPAVPSVDLSDIPEGTLDIDSHLPLLMVALTDIAYQWEHLGTQLGLKYGKLKEIKKTEIGIQMDCMREMLAAWLLCQGGVCSKQALKTALQKIGCSS